MFYMIASWCSD